jgi:hypothetical protein
VKVWLKNVLWGIGQFMWCAVPAAIVAALVYNSDPGSWNREQREPIGSLLTLYFSGAIAAGIVLGSLRPWTRGVFGKGVVAACCALPITFLLVLMAEGWNLSAFDGFHVGMVIFLAAFFGPATAAYIHIRERQRKQRSMPNGGL